MELMCDRLYIIDNGIIIGEKTIDQVQEATEEDIYSYTFMTSDNGRVYDYFKSLDSNCDRANGGVTVVMKREQIPGIIRTLMGMDIDIYAVNQAHRTLEQDFISMTTGTKTQIR
jgi:ABC-2 type transport system ATP-binding protein